MADPTNPTPAQPATYMPIPGQSTSTPDQANAAQSKAQNSNASSGAATVNDVKLAQGASDGNLYTGITTPISDAATQQTTFTDTATIAKGPKGDKGDKGDPGPIGPTGPAGPAGPAGVVDYDAIRAIIQEMLNDMLNVKVLQFVTPHASQVFGGKSIELPVELADTIQNTSAVVQPTFTITPSGLATITSAGHFVATNPASDTAVTVVANYTDTSGKNYTCQTNITIKAFKVVSLAVTGPSSINSAGTGTYVATATYSDATTAVVTANSATTWTTTVAGGTMAANVLTAPVVAANATGLVKASYVESGITVNGQASVTIAAPVIKPFYGAAAHPVAATNADPTAYTGWSDFVLALSGQGTNGSKLNTFAINQGTTADAKYGWYAYPQSYGLMDQSKIKGAAQPGPGGWDSALAPNGRTGSFWGTSGPLSIQVTINGSPVAFYLYRTDNVGVSDTWTVSA